jgi:hypothetical protein
MRVELDIFSGRPNPSWELTVEEAYHLAMRLADLPAAVPEFTPRALGYRGLVIFNPEGISGLPGQIRIHKGIVTIDDPESKYYRDSNDIERWLLELGRAHGYGPVIDQATKDNS